MKNRIVRIVIGLFKTRNTGVRIHTPTIETLFVNHDSVKIFSIVVKDHGKSLLIKHPEVTE